MFHKSGFVIIFIIVILLFFSSSKKLTNKNKNVKKKKSEEEYLRTLTDTINKFLNGQLDDNDVIQVVDVSSQQNQQPGKPIQLDLNGRQVKFSHDQKDYITSSTLSEFDMLRFSSNIKMKTIRIDKSKINQKSSIGIENDDFDENFNFVKEVDNAEINIVEDDDVEEEEGKNIIDEKGEEDDKEEEEEKEIEEDINKVVVDKIQEIINDEKLRVELERNLTKLFVEIYKSQNIDKKKRVTEAIKEFEEYSIVTNLALYFLGRVYESDRFGRYNFTKSKYYFLKSGVDGNDKSQYKLGVYFANGLITKEDVEIIEKETNSSLNYTDYNSNAISFLYYFFSALGGNLKSQAVLGYKYFIGVDVAKKCDAAVVYYHLASKQYSPKDVQSKPISKYYLQDKEAKKSLENEENLIDYLKQNALRGDGNSQIVLGYANMFGARGLEVNAEQARGYFEQAIEQGNMGGYAPLGSMYAYGMGVEQNNETALKYFKEGALKNDPKSQNGLGYMYLHGAGVETDLQKAFSYFNNSAAQGNAEGQYNLAVMYFNGYGTPRNYQKAFHYTKLSATNGQVLAFQKLGEMYMNGLGTSKNCQIAVKNFRDFIGRQFWDMYGDPSYKKYVKGETIESLLSYIELSEAGEEVAQINAGYMLENGIGVDIFGGDNNAIMEQSFKMYERASQQGNVEAHLKVGDLYYYGIGTQVDFNKSVYHYRKASDMQNSQATFNLGYLHESGKGLDKDYFLAKRFYDLSSQYNKHAYLASNLALGRLFIKWGISFLPGFGGSVSRSHNILGGGRRSSGISLIDWVLQNEIFVLIFLCVVVLILTFIKNVKNRKVQLPPEDHPHQD